MSFRFFTIPMQGAGDSEAELNEFLSCHKVLAVDRRWVDQGENSFWAFCVDYLPRGAGRANSARSEPSRTRVDYKDILSPEEFIVFAKLRQLRKDIAQAEAIPIYAVFTNQQLATMVQKRAQTKGALDEIAGVGDARVQKFGDRVLDLLKTQWSAGDATDGKSV